MMLKTGWLKIYSDVIIMTDTTIAMIFLFVTAVISIVGIAWIIYEVKKMSGD